ncbi:MAG: membrane dipeptidase [Anaerolineales bacterium]|nr:membrane dipeptidase [Anaerolineales bacterium]
MPGVNANKHALEIIKKAIVIDGHSDILIPLAEGRMSLSQRVEAPDPSTWEPPAGLVMEGRLKTNDSAHSFYYGPMGQYDIPRWLEGGVTAQVCTIYVSSYMLGRGLHRGLEMAWALFRAVEESEAFEMVTKAADITRIKQLGKCGAILSMEGFEALASDLRILDIYYRLGLRMAGLTHNRRNAFADGPQPNVQTGGLTELGRQAIRRMNELGIVIDMAHINEAGFWEILDLTTAPVVLSHSTGSMFNRVDQIPGSYPRPGLVLPRDRARLEALAANGGVLGIIFHDQGSLDNITADIGTALEVMGPDHVGLGSDFCGLEKAPRGLEDISRLPALVQQLVERGYGDEVILKILGGNFVRVFEQVWRD